MVERHKKNWVKLFVCIGIIGMYFTLERYFSSTPSFATTETTVSISVLAAPFSMRFDPSPATRNFDHQKYYSPGTIYVREHRQNLQGWSIQGQLTALEHENTVIKTYVEVTPAGSSSLDELNFPAGENEQPAYHILVSAMPGYGRGRYEIRPYYLIDNPDDYLFSFTAL